MILCNHGAYASAAQIRANYPTAAAIVAYGHGWIVFRTAAELAYWRQRSHQTSANSGAASTRALNQKTRPRGGFLVPLGDTATLVGQKGGTQRERGLAAPFAFARKSLILLVGARGFEPPTT
jgi:hypothetical protein